MVCLSALLYSSVVVAAMTAWFALFNRRDFKLSFAVLLIRIHCTGSVQFPVKVGWGYQWWVGLPVVGGSTCGGWSYL